MTVPLRAALYLRVSTARQAEHDVSIPISASRAKRIASQGATIWSKPMSMLELRPPMIAVRNSSA